MNHQNKMHYRDSHPCSRRFPELFAGWILALAFLLAVILCPVKVQAYTDAEKRQAKAWLSSHGYPPTEDGAWQAYSDWLDGKWWDEFGSPDEYFGVGEGDDDEDGDEDDGKKPTAATQKSQDGSGKGKSGGGSGGSGSGNGGSGSGDGEDGTGPGQSGAGNLIGAMEGETESETSLESSISTEGADAEGKNTGTIPDSSAKGVPAIPAVPIGATTAAEAELPTAATQADIQELVEAVEETDEDRVGRMMPLAMAGIGAVAVLLIGVIVWDHRKR